MPVDDPFQGIQPVGDESPVTADAQVRRQRLEQPEGRVHGVVFRRLTTVRKPIGYQALVEIPDVGVEHGTGFPERPRPDRQARQADHRVPSPVGEPVIAGDHGSPLGRRFPGRLARDTELFGGNHQLRGEWMVGRRIAQRRLSLSRGLR